LIVLYSYKSYVYIVRKYPRVPYSIEFEFILRPFGNYGSGRMDDDGMNWWNEEIGRKWEHPPNRFRKQRSVGQSKNRATFADSA